MEKPAIDQEGFVKAGPVKLFRVTRGQVEAYDKDKNRSSRRGSCYVYLNLDDLIRVLQEAREEAKEK